MLRLSYKNLNKRHDYCLITQFFISRCYVFKRWSFFDLKGGKRLSFAYPSLILRLSFAQPSLKVRKGR